jgi:hypothetical protein
VTTGQQVPEDLAPADGERLLGFLGDSGSRSAVSAA